MMDSVFIDIKYVMKFFMIIIILVSLFHWIRVKFWVPKYIHFFALFIFLLEVFALFFANNLSKALEFEFILVFIGTPLLPYIVFGFYGGKYVAVEKKINDFLVIDRSLNQEKIILILESKLKPFQMVGYEKLSFLIQNMGMPDLFYEEGRKYKFELIVTIVPPEGQKFLKEKLNIESTLNMLMVTGLLTSLSHFLYKPKSWTSFIIDIENNIVLDGIEILKMDEKANI